MREKTAKKGSDKNVKQYDQKNEMVQWQNTKKVKEKM